MAQRFEIAEGDTAPSVKMRVEERDYNGDWDGVDLTGATVTFKMANSAGTLVVNSAGSVDATANVTGVVQYDWASGDTATAGTYTAEFDIVTASARRMTCPANKRDKLYVIINADVG